MKRKRKLSSRENEFSKARSVMSKHFDKDRSLYDGYRANIAMWLYDHHGIKDYKDRNRAAEGILSLIFCIAPSGVFKN